MFSHPITVTDEIGTLHLFPSLSLSFLICGLTGLDKMIFKILQATSETVCSQELCTPP